MYGMIGIVVAGKREREREKERERKISSEREMWEGEPCVVRSSFLTSKVASIARLP